MAINGFKLKGGGDAGRHGQLQSRGLRGEGRKVGDLEQSVFVLAELVGDAVTAGNGSVGLEESIRGETFSSTGGREEGGGGGGGGEKRIQHGDVKRTRRSHGWTG